MKIAIPSMQEWRQSTAFSERKQSGVNEENFKNFTIEKESGECA